MHAVFSGILNAASHFGTQLNLAHDVKLACPKCHRGHEVAEEKRRRVTQVKCRSCGQIFQISGRSNQGAVWYAVIGGKQAGPFSLAELKSRMARGELKPRHFVWRAGMSDWKRASELAELSPRFKTCSPRPAPAEELDTGEATRFFMEQAGVTKRNPAWKFAVFGAAAIVIPVGLLFILSAVRVVPLKVTRVDDSGREVTDSVFSAGGVSGLKDLLLGKRSRAHETRTKHLGPPPDSKPAEAPVSERNLALESLYQDSSKKDLSPRLHRSREEPAKDVAAGLTTEEIHKVVDRTLPAFQNCIEIELRRNPALKGGPLVIVASVGSSGQVKEARIDRRDIESSNLGECLRRRARSMVFRSSREETDVEIPLKVIKSL